jgi:hypothetical protein
MYEEYLKLAHADIINYKKLISSKFKEYFSDTIEYAYFKGSALNKWDSFLDYVPIVSDLDVHIKVKDNKLTNDFLKTLEFTDKVRSSWREHYPNAFHLPRLQVVFIHDMEELSRFVPSHPDLIEVFIGEHKPKPQPDRDTMRKYDLDNLMDMEQTLQNLSHSFVDRYEQEYYIFLRRMVWKISPTPVRLLSQIYDPHEVWTWNRSIIYEKLIESGYHQIADTIKNYYRTGWELYLSDFSHENYIEIFKWAYLILKYCTEAGKHFL